MHTSQPISPSRQRGAMLPLVALLIVALVGIFALALDVGYLVAISADLQATADSAALAGATGLEKFGSDSGAEARRRASEYAAANSVDGHAVAVSTTAAPGQTADVQLGRWTGSSFQPLDSSGNVYPNAVRVTPRLTGSSALQLFLAGIFNQNSADAAADAVAVLQARDIVLVLDYSRSMCYDSQIRSINKLGRTAIEENLRQIWLAMNLTKLKNMPAKLQITSTNPTYILQQLGIPGAAYPFPGHGSWSEYFAYVQSLNQYQDGDYYYYDNRYGYLTLVNYWLEKFGLYNEIPLANTPEQPVTAVKDAVDLFLAYLELGQTDDRVGLVAYTYTNNKANVEVPLTAGSLSTVATRSRQMQAGHYENQTNIAAGMRTGLAELQAHTRQGAFRVMVLLSDGRANFLDNGTIDERRARLNALDQADAAAAVGVPILTISLGADADTDLMDEIARRTKGKHFIVPGGQSVESYQEDLYEIFAAIAAHRPAKLVH